MPIQSTDGNYGKDYRLICTNCGLPFYHQQAGDITCSCPPYDVHTKRVNKIEQIVPGSVYAGKIAGIPVYVNSMKDLEELRQFMRDTIYYWYPTKED
jgi:hypothetical protein